jgi:hypothetical protein
VQCTYIALCARSAMRPKSSNDREMTSTDSGEVAMKAQTALLRTPSILTAGDAG